MSSSTATHSIRRPAWADDSSIDPDLNSAVITHIWTAPTVAEGTIGANAGCPLHVQLSQTDDVIIDADAVTYVQGAARIFLPDLDGSFASNAEARRYAAAILEACDRLDMAEADER